MVAIATHKGADKLSMGMEFKDLDAKFEKKQSYKLKGTAHYFVLKYCHLA